MTNEEILNIVKLKYPDTRISEDGRIIMGESGHYEEIDGAEKFIAEVLICIENNKIIFYHHKKDFLGYIIKCRSKIEYEFKNLIELKHILKLDITRDDIVNYLEKELHSEYTVTDDISGWELARIEGYDNLVVEEYEQDGNFQLSILKVKDFYNYSIISIFNASNPNEYWRLYNIINNLIGEKYGSI